MFLKHKVILNLFCILLFFPFHDSFAQNAPITTVATIANASPGNIDVPIIVTGFNNIGAISLSIDYDYDVMHFTGSTPNPALPSFPAGDLDLGTGYHRITMGWFGSATTLADNSTIITLHFYYISGITELTWYDNGPSCEYADADFNVLNDIPTESFYINGFVCGIIGSGGSITGNDTLCQGEMNEPYSITPMENVTGYSWSVPDGATIVSGQNTNIITVDYSDTAISGNISVYGFNNCGNGPELELFVTVNNLPVANAGNDTTINYGTSTTMHAEPGGTGSFSYHWSPEESLVDPDVQNPLTIIMTETTIFTVQVTNEETFCQNSEQVTVTITGGPLSVNPIAQPSQVCLGNSAQLFSNAGGGSGNYTFEWTSNPPGSPPWSSNLANPFVSPETASQYLLTVYDGFTTVEGSTNLIVSPLPSSNISGGDTLCGENVFTTLQVDLTGIPPWNFTYSFGNTSVFINNLQESPYYIITADPGDYIITAIEDANCDGTSYGTAIVRKYPIPAKPEITVIGYELISSSCCGNQWYMDDSAIPGETGQTYNTTESGQYYVVVTLNSCSSEPSEIVDLVVGIDEIAINQFQIFPNPANSVVTFHTHSAINGSLKIRLSTIEGMLVREYEFVSGQDFIIAINELSQGLYFLILSYEGHQTIGKLIVR